MNSLKYVQQAHKLCFDNCRVMPLKTEKALAFAPCALVFLIVIYATSIAENRVEQNQNNEHAMW